MNGEMWAKGGVNMDFHGHFVDLDKVNSELAMEFARRELNDLEEEKKEKGETILPQDRLDSLYSSYFEAYGYLCNKTVEHARCEFEHTFVGD